MQKIFEPSSVAIVGASEKKGKIGNILIKNLQSRINDVEIFPVNPISKKIEKIKAYASVLDIEDEVDLAVIAVPAKFVNKVVEECSWREQPIKNIVIISAGFGEAGEAGVKRKEKLEELIEEYDLNILGPNCLGVINATKSINLSFAKQDVSLGGVGLISQSGAFITAMIDIAEQEAFGFSLIASLGNKIDIGENELLDYYLQDEDTKIIALYLESISKGKEFQEKIKLVAKRKPVVIIKAGTTSRTKQAIQSHTGSMAGESVVIEEAIKSAGGILVDNLEDFVTLIKLLNNFSWLQSNKLAVVTNAGGPGVITTDLIENSGLELLEFTKKEKELLETNLPEESSVENPIDLLGDAQEDRYEATLEILQGIENVGGVLALVTPQSQTPIKKIVKSIIRANQNFSFPIFPVVIGGDASNEAEGICQRYELNNFRFPVELVRALAKLPKVDLGEDVSVEKKEETISKHNKKNGTMLSYGEAESMAKEAELNTLPATYLNNGRDVEDVIEDLGLPLVMKVDSPNIIHKNAKNGVVVGLDTLERVKDEFERFQETFPGDKILVQPQVDAGLEIILGLKRDESFGLVLVIGLGGIITEILDEKILFVGEVSEELVRKKLSKSKLAKILKKEKISEEDLVEQALKLFELGEKNPDIKEIDVNPIFFYPDKESVIVDFKIIK